MKIYSVKELVPVLGLCAVTIRKLIIGKKLKKLNISGKIKVSQYMLDEFLKGRE